VNNKFCSFTLILVHNCCLVMFNILINVYSSMTKSYQPLGCNLLGSVYSPLDWNQLMHACMSVRYFIRFLSFDFMIFLRMILAAYCYVNLWITLFFESFLIKYFLHIVCITVTADRVLIEYSDHYTNWLYSRVDFKGYALINVLNLSPNIFLFIKFGCSFLIWSLNFCSFKFGYIGSLITFIKNSSTCGS
jgi:hypothetical protein